MFSSSEINSFSYSLLGDIMKRFFSMLSVLILVCFSFFYTEQVAKFVRKTDPIYQQIEEVASEYEIAPVNATIDLENIIPGISGKKVNIDQSYTNMKRLGEFNEGLLVFDEIVPEISSLKQYDKYIVKGNQNNDSISLVFIGSESTYLNKVMEILKEKEVSATFFVDGNSIEENRVIVEELAKNGNQIENLGYNGSYQKERFIWTNNLIESLTKVEPKYCYTKYKDSKVLDLCSSYHMYTIRPTIITGNYPFQTIKQKIEKGAIIQLDLNETTIKELKTIIAYVKQKGYSIETLSNLINENRVIEK